MVRALGEGGLLRVLRAEAGLGLEKVLPLVHAVHDGQGLVRARRAHLLPERSEPTFLGSVDQNPLGATD